MKAITIPITQLSHKQRVLKVYKEIVRNLEAWYYYRPAFRYRATLMRARFDENKDVPLQKAAELVKDAEEELWKKLHYNEKLFPNTLRGIAYGRDAYAPDWLLDYWHPLEKAQYPEYFCRREQRKKEYIEMWEEKYGSSSSEKCD